MDVKIIFLNGDLKEEVYMERPERFIINGQGKSLQTCQIITWFEANT